MRLALCSFLGLLLTFESVASQEPKVKVDSNGISVNKGRHNLQVNVVNTKYDYNGRRFNVNAEYNYWNQQASVGVNRGNHGLHVGYDHKNEEVGATYSWTFGKRRRRELGSRLMKVQTAEVRLRELAHDLKILKNFVPEIDQVTLPSHSGPITDEILAQDLICLAQQLGRVIPQMELFIKKFAAKHGPAYRMKAESVYEVIPGCQILPIPTSVNIAPGPPILKGAQLVEMKTFVSELILTGFEVRAHLGRG